MEETIALGEALAPYMEVGKILQLIGDLGVGKTCLTRGIVKGLNGDAQQVRSPTYNLVHEYETPKLAVIHCDFYRISPEESESILDDLGGLEFFYQEKLFIVEWFSCLPKPIILDLKEKTLSIELFYRDQGRSCLLPSSMAAKVLK